MNSIAVVAAKTVAAAAAAALLSLGVAGGLALAAAPSPTPKPAASVKPSVPDPRTDRRAAPLRHGVHRQLLRERQQGRRVAARRVRGGARAYSHPSATGWRGLRARTPDARGTARGEERAHTTKHRDTPSPAREFSGVNDHAARKLAPVRVASLPSRFSNSSISTACRSPR